MADNILKNSLSGLSSQPLPDVPKAMQAPDLSGNAGKDIASLKGAQQQPSDLLNLQKSLQVGSSEAYKQRQATEMEITSGQFDPTKVSGGTFAGIIGNLEQNRGMDISKIYAATMSTYSQVQDTITKRLQFLEQLEEDKRQFEEEMKLKKKELARLEASDKQAAKEFKKTLEESKRQFDMDYQQKATKLNQANGVDTMKLYDAAVGWDGNPAPNSTSTQDTENQWWDHQDPDGAKFNLGLMDPNSYILGWDGRVTLK